MNEILRILTLERCKFQKWPWEANEIRHLGAFLCDVTEKHRNQNKQKKKKEERRRFYDSLWCLKSRDDK